MIVNYTSEENNIRKTLMLFHVVWATIVFLKKDKEKLQSFHKFSIVVWLIWLIPYVIGLIIGMSK